MEHTFMTELQIKKVRHLSEISIPLSIKERKNLLLTGKNGSGKTSVLKSLVDFLDFVISNHFDTQESFENSIDRWTKQAKSSVYTDDNGKANEQALRNVKYYENELKHWTNGCTAHFTSVYQLREKYRNGQFILALYGDTRKIDVQAYKNIEKIDLKTVYGMTDHPSKELGKYLVNLKSTQAFALAKNDMSRANQIGAWFDRFVSVLRRIYKDDYLDLDFDIDTFQFSIHVTGREPFGFNTMSMGYAAIFDIVSDLIMRMEMQHNWNTEGIVIIDEVETHLHVELQKEVVPILTELFPNIQFVITTHSPFVLSSAQNATVYDLEKRTLVENGLTNLPYEGIIEGYFNVDLLSLELRRRFEQYKSLVQKPLLSNLDYAQIAELEYYLDEVPDYLAVDFAETYSRLKNEFENRG